MVDDVGRIGVGSEQRLEDLGVEAPPRGDRDARPDRVPRELVPEADVSRIDLEQLPALRLFRRDGPAGHHGVEHRRPDATGNHRHQLDEASCGIVEPRGAAEHRVRDRRGQVGAGQ